MSRAYRLLLWAAATDRTFDVVVREGVTWLEGKCIHCRRKLALEVRADARGGAATLEHILPKHHGGTDALENLAVACGRCNNGKGVRLDARPLTDPTLTQVLQTLRARRAERKREAPEGLVLPPLPKEHGAS